MILVFGGTTEGRHAVHTLEQGDKEYFYSTKGNTQQVRCIHGHHICGDMNRDEMIGFCHNHGIKAIVDAAHPFASRLRATINESAQTAGIPVVRYERTYPEYKKNIIWCSDYNDATDKLSEHGITNLLALTGVQTIGKLRDFWKRRHTVFRILNREESLQKAAEQGFPTEQLAFYENESTEHLIERLHPEAILTKESGESGGFEEKLRSAEKHGIKIFVIKRPPVPDNFIKVTGEAGLRKSIEKLVPGFFALRSGFTTGACACAAAKAALLALIADDFCSEIEFSIPSGECMHMPVKNVSVSDTSATATVVKDAGDDPDVTNGCEISATVAFADTPGIHFFGGEGIGTVSLPGTGLEIGEPAINPVPRQMIEHELCNLYPGGLNVTVSVPGGEKLALRTFNSRIGITGGISIIGTSGIVMPYSHEAFIDAIKKQISVARAIGVEHLVLNSGARSERFLRQAYPQLPPQAFIHYGNAIGDAIAIARESGIRKLTIGIMLGKAVKLAEGNMDTHSRTVTANKDFLCGVALKCGCSPETVNAIRNINMARELWNKINRTDSDKFFTALLELCHKHCSKLIPENNVEIMLIRDDGNIPYSIK